MKSTDIVSVLKDGEIFTKYGKMGNPHLRFVKLSDDEKKIVWYTLSGCKIFKKTKFIDVSDVNI